ncbi:MAG: alpha/beta fold hydrolase [Solirubrobacteraceae bacterium]
MLASLEAAPDAGARGTLLCLHGYPESSHMFAPLVGAAARAGWRAFAPDLPGYGDSEPDPPHTWTRMVAAVDAFWRERIGEPVALVVHDWGGLIGLRWACERPEAIRALVISDTGFFPDGRWHGLAEAMRAEGQGEQLVDGMTREGFGQLLHGVTPAFDDDALDEYFKAFGDEVRRRGQLELYRSGEFSELEQYDGRLTALGVSVLLLWGEDDPFAPVAGAHRFARELPGARVEVLPGTGHFVFDEQPEQTTALVLEFLAGL